ncbi:MAG TPA: AgmX/PglI C-terminal domain-containing protein [Myxococcales bacterium]|jgi:hypothetical protein
MASDGLGVDVGTTGGSWLFKQGDLLLGPVPFSKLVELLFAGELDENTPVAPFNLEPKFQALGTVEKFRVHLAKAKAKLRVEVASESMHKERRRGRLMKLVSMGTVSLVLLLGGGYLAVWLAIHRPWEKQIQLPEPVITDELPSIKLASARTGEDELAYPDAVKNPSHPGTNPKIPKPVGPKNPATPNPKNPANPANPKDPTNPGGLATKMPDNDVGVVQQWDQEGINGVVKTNKVSLHPCLSAEAKRQKPGWETRVPIEFTIGNDGRITKLWIDNPDYKSEDTELFKCMFTALQKWKFPVYNGEQANVSLAFRINSPK